MNMYTLSSTSTVLYICKGNRVYNSVTTVSGTVVVRKAQKSSHTHTQRKKGTKEKSVLSTCVEVSTLLQVCFGILQ